MKWLKALYYNLTPIQKSLVKDALFWIPFLILLNVLMFYGAK